MNLGQVYSPLYEYRAVAMARFADTGAGFTAKRKKPLTSQLSVDLLAMLPFTGIQKSAWLDMAGLHGDERQLGFSSIRNLLNSGRVVLRNGLYLKGSE